MDALTAKMVPKCVGRYLIDVPSQMVLGINTKTFIDKVDIASKPMARSLFDLEIKQREAELREDHLDGKPQQPTLKEIIPLEGLTGKIFNRSEYRSSNVLRVLELHSWKDNYSIKMLIGARDMAYAVGDESDIHDKRKTTVPEKLAILLKMFSNIRGRADAEIPTEQGVCFANGFMRGPAGSGEDLGMSYMLRDQTDVYLHIESDSGIRESTTLLDRSREINAMVKVSEGRTIRKGKRSSNGIDFEEWLIAGNTDEPVGFGGYVKGHFFTSEANSKIGSAKTPLLNIDLHNGQRPDQPDDAEYSEITKASLSEPEAITLWDAIMRTLRPRPGAF